jgi:type I restriction enzyme S subunit
LEHLEPGSLQIRAWGIVADGTTFTRRCHRGHVLFGKRRAYQRKVAVAEFDAVVSGDIYVLAPKNDRLSPELLPFLCLSERFFQHAVGTSAGSLSPRTNWTSLASFEFNLPSLDQQRRIAGILWAIDELSRKLSVTHECAVGFGRQYLESLFKYQGSGSQKTSFGTIKPDWRLSTMGEEGDVQLGQQKHPKYDRGSNIRPYLRVDNIRDGWIDQSSVLQMHFPENELTKFELGPDDILLNEGQTREYLGRSAIYRGEIPGCCFQKTLIRFRCGQSLLPEYAHSFFRFLLYSGFFASHASQTAIAHITAIRFKRMPIPVPPLNEQKQIIETVKRIEKSKEALGSHVTAVRSMLLSLVESLS